MSRLAFRTVIFGAVIALLGIASYAIAGGAKHNLKAVTLTGYQENLDVSTAAEGTFEAKIAKDDSSISYTLSYSSSRAPSRSRTSTSASRRSTAASRCGSATRRSSRGRRDQQ